MRSRNRRIARYLIGVLAFLGVAVGVVWAFFPLLVTFGVEYALKGVGFSGIAVGRSDLRWDGLSLSSVRFSYGDAPVEGEISSLEVGWRLGDLRHGRVTRVAISGAAVSIGALVGEGPATATPPEIRVVPSLIPVDHLTLSTSVLSFSGGVLTVQSLTGDLDRSGEGITVGGVGSIALKAFDESSEHSPSEWEVAATITGGRVILDAPTRIALAPYAQSLSVTRPLTVTWSPLSIVEGELVAQEMRLPTANGTVSATSAKMRFPAGGHGGEGDSLPPFEAQGEVYVEGLGFENDVVTVLPHDLGGEVSFSPRMLELSLNGVSKQLKKLHGSVRFDLVDRGGEWRVTLPPKPLGELGSVRVGEKVKVVSGSVGGSAHGAWGATPYAKIAGEISDAVIDAHGAAVEGVGIRVAIDTRGGLHTIEPAKVTIRSVALPVPLTNITGTVEWHGDRLAVTDAKAGVLGGDVRVSSTQIPFGAGRWTVPLNVKDIDLARLLAVYPQERVSGSGVLSGSLTVEYDGAAFSINNGLLHSEHGRIRYDAAGLSEVNAEGLNIALGALRNFAYDLLRARLDLRPSGALTVGIELQGRNPEWQKGRPVHFNLSVEENIYKLIESIKLARGDFGSYGKSGALRKVGEVPP